ncbi:MAG TPA: hypothetical protein VGW77_34445 [Candidatus Binatia bacterium]|nr:hypothetical protein [Candidatus Binatia bacterium]
MRLLKWVLVRALLIKTFLKTLARQVYLKLTKFTRRSRGAKNDFFGKFAAGYDFLKHVSLYNWEVIQRSRLCLKQLAAENVQEVFVYGERDVTEVLYSLTFEFPVKLNTLGEHYKIYSDLASHELPIETSASRPEKVVIASLVNIEERAMRLREIGVDERRIVFLS